MNNHCVQIGEEWIFQKMYLKQSWNSQRWYREQIWHKRVRLTGLEEFSTLHYFNIILLKGSWIIISSYLKCYLRNIFKARKGKCMSVSVWCARIMLLITFPNMYKPRHSGEIKHLFPGLNAYEIVFPLFYQILLYIFKKLQ